MINMDDKKTYPRLYIKESTHNKVKKIAKKMGVDQKDLGDKIARAGIVSLGL